MAEIHKGTPTKKVVKENKNALLKSILVITILLSFTILLAGGYWIFKEQAPRPVEVTNEKGDVLLILEAMKMENAILIHTNAKIKKVIVTAGQAVDKGQVLVELE